jgi:hypothetical protein
MSEVTDILQAIEADSPSKVIDAVNDILMQRAAAALEARKQEVAKTLIVPHTPEEVTADEEV